MTLSRCFPIRFVRCPPSKFFIASINSPSRSFGGEGSLHSLVKIPQLFLISSVMQHYNCVAGESFWYLRLFNIHPKIRSNLTHRRKRLSRCHVQIVDPCSFPVLQRLSGQPRTGECCSRFESSWSIRRFLVGRSFLFLRVNTVIDSTALLFIGYDVVYSIVADPARSWLIWLIFFDNALFYCIEEDAADDHLLAIC